MHRAILLFGYPGSGKGTQSKVLTSLEGFHHVAMGEIFRSLTEQHPLYNRVKEQLNSGHLISDEMVVELFEKYLKNLNLNPKDFLILDGIPRNPNQVKILKSKVEVIKIFKLSIYDEKILIDRIKKRAKIENRPDDGSDEIIRNRLKIYRKETEPTLNSYPGTLLTRIQANQPIFDVHLDIITSLGKLRDIYFP